MSRMFANKSKKKKRQSSPDVIVTFQLIALVHIAKITRIKRHLYQVHLHPQQFSILRERLTSIWHHRYLSTILQDFCPLLLPGDDRGIPEPFLGGQCLLASGSYMDRPFAFPSNRELSFYPIMKVRRLGLQLSRPDGQQLPQLSSSSDPRWSDVLSPAKSLLFLVPYWILPRNYFETQDSLQPR